MKILRVRRGFSTNCSGANEYFPPGNVDLEPPEDEAADAGPTVIDPGRVVFRWFTFMPDGAPPPMVREALSGDSNDGGAATSGDGAPVGSAKVSTRESSDAGIDGGETGVDDRVAADPGRSSGGVGLVVFFVMVGVLVLYGVGRLLGKLKRGDDGSGSR